MYEEDMTKSLILLDKETKNFKETQQTPGVLLLGFVFV